MSSIDTIQVDQAFETWKALVNRWCEKECGMSCDDLPDVDYYAMYGDDYTPRRAAKSAIKQSGF